VTQQLPPQPQVDFAVERNGLVHEAIGHLAHKNGDTCAIRPNPILGILPYAWTIKRDTIVDY
jgi:hypothetical protein